ncbi:hypothetical protein NPIL_255661, partial [Nephila pilipes]
ASSLELGIPMAKILDETREAYSPDKQFGLTTRKDLQYMQIKLGKRVFCIQMMQLQSN